MSNELVAIVDDDSAVRKTLNLFLQSEGINTVQYIRGEDLIVALDEGKDFYAILMDTDMGYGNMKGYDVCRKVNEKYAHIPVVGLSGNHSYEQSWIDAKAHRFFLKPFDFNELTKLVKSYRPAA